ncbi:hypothetical protein CLOM_g11718 [Closterium sp. NIES-68]|nr:hypothetical protein CLOM_g11718 [Closterium sp. NIES-68]GJP75081.1 hypothetical protein CLOP_g5576 [Closterium sp. NIES-67]
MSIDWRWDDRLKPVLGLRTEGACKSSWAITAVTAVEMVYAIVASAFPSLPPAARVSLQQVLDCEPSNSSCGGGGWPTSALDYMVDATLANGGVATDAAYPYIQKQGACNATRAKKLLKETTPKAIGVIGYDQVDFYGWLGLALAVQTQPTIAFVRGSHATFLSYRKGTYNDRNCAQGVVDHSVVVVGYEMDNYDTLPYWIVRNSWGDKWGEKGYMRMAMVGGIGICGIHTVPAIYPVIKTPSPCNDQINPCGWGDCEANPDGPSPPYVCSCADGFVPVINDDGTPTCAIDDVCSQFEGGNPCGVGSCLSDEAGGYLCLCPPGFKRGLRAKGSEICVPTADRPSNISYPMDVDCELVYQIYGLSEEKFLAQNPDLENNEGWCDMVPANTVVNVTLPPSAIICGLFYSWSANDTCAAVADGFDLTVAELQRLNPGVRCSGKIRLPTPNQQVCVQEGNGADMPVCTLFYTVAPGDDCDKVMARFKLSAISFYTLNPGLSCASLFPYLSGPDDSTADQEGGPSLSGTQVCVSGYTVNATGPAPARSLRSLNPQVAMQGRPESPNGAWLRGDRWGSNDDADPDPVMPVAVNRRWQSWQQQQQPQQQQQSWQQWMHEFLTQIAASGPGRSNHHGSQQMASMILHKRLLHKRLLVAKQRTKPKCKAYYYVQRGDFCARIIALKFQNSARKMSDLNSGYVCNNDRLYVGMGLCTQR